MGCGASGLQRLGGYLGGYLGQFKAVGAHFGPAKGLDPALVNSSWKNLCDADRV